MDSKIDNARELVLLLWHECHKYVAEKKFDSRIDYLARIITARDEAIRRECANIHDLYYDANVDCIEGPYTKEGAHAAIANAEKRP